MLRRLVDRFRRRDKGAGRPTGEPAPRDFAQDREDSRQGRLSEEDRAWQEASLRRDRERRERDQSPPGG